MWYITNNESKLVYYLTPQTSGHTVGRANTDLLISGDESISRNHAILQPDDHVLNLTDSGSRYGSYVNENIARIVCIRKDCATPLKAGDTVQFGRMGNIWTVGKVSFRCLTSTLTMTDQLRTIIRKTGAEIMPGYDATLTHLIMPTITITTKLLQCLVGQVPIVTPEYFYAIDSSITKRSALPSEDDYVPKSVETYIRSDAQLFQPNANRRNLFKGKEFIFLNDAQCKQYEEIIVLAGGICLCAHRTKIAKSRFIKPNAVTIKLEPSGSSQSQTFNAISQFVTSNGFRMVPVLEIGLAVMYASTERYCNPEYNFAFNVMEACTPAVDVDLLAKNTEQQSENAAVDIKNIVEMNTVPETEPHSERPAGEASAITRLSAGRSNQISVVSPHRTSSRLNPIVNIPEARRQSKRQIEMVENHKSSIGTEINQPKRVRKAATPPMESVSYSPMDVPETEPDASSMENVLHIPETQPSSDPVPSQAMQASGFRAVRRQPLESERIVEKSCAKSRPKGSLFDLDDDLFNLEECAPRKKQKLGSSSVVESRIKPSGTSSSSHGQRAAAGRKNNGSFVNEDLFCFDEDVSTVQRQNGGLKRKENHASTNQHQPLTDVSVQSISRASEKSTFAHKDFFKAIELSTYGWRVSSDCGKQSNDVDSCRVDGIQIKTEPFDEIDGETKEWLKDIGTKLEVLEIRKPLHTRRPTDEDGQELPCVTSNGGVNFKAFAKIRFTNKTQRSLITTKPINVLDDMCE